MDLHYLYINSHSSLVEGGVWDWGNSHFGHTSRVVVQFLESIGLKHADTGSLNLPAEGNRMECQQHLLQGPAHHFFHHVAQNTGNSEPQVRILLWLVVNRGNIGGPHFSCLA